MAGKKTNSIIGLIGVVVFGVFAIIVPLLKLTGFGFLYLNDARGIADFFWDTLESSSYGISNPTTKYADLIDLWIRHESPSNIEIVWILISLWGLIFIGFGLFGTLLVAIPPLQRLGGMEPLKIGRFGLIFGLVASIVEVLLFTIAGLFERNIEGGIENLGWIAIILSFIGWIGLIIGYMYGSRD
ncbi:MAG: hypothetical protein ACFE9L_15350 [Candidatus Hodarchaeota archaeon]